MYSPLVSLVALLASFSALALYLLLQGFGGGEGASHCLMIGGTNAVSVCFVQSMIDAYRD